MFSSKYSTDSLMMGMVSALFLNVLNTLLLLLGWG